MCEVNEPVDNEAFVLGASRNNTVRRFSITSNRKVKHLPRHIGALFPNLQGFWGERCGLTIVRNHYFKDMQNLRFLYLYSNKIASIEPDAFIDLTSVKELWLHYNLIEILDDQIFIKMVALEGLYLSYNRIQFLGAATFKIPDGKINMIFLKGNVCIDRNYASNNYTQLEHDLGVRCSN